MSILANVGKIRNAKVTRRMLNGSHEIAEHLGLQKTPIGNFGNIKARVLLLTFRATSHSDLILL